MTPNTTLEITRINPDDASKRTVTLVAEQQTGGRSSKQWYLTLPEYNRNLPDMIQLFGEEYCQDCVFDAIDAKLQDLLLKQASGNLDKFKQMVETETLSGRKETAAYCARKGALLMAGNKKKGIAPNMQEAMKWIMKSQVLMQAEMLEANTKE